MHFYGLWTGTRNPCLVTPYGCISVNSGKRYISLKVVKTFSQQTSVEYWQQVLQNQMISKCCLDFQLGSERFLKYQNKHLSAVSKAILIFLWAEKKGFTCCCQFITIRVYNDKIILNKDSLIRFSRFLQHVWTSTLCFTKHLLTLS